MLFTVLGPWICQSVCVQSEDYHIVKATNASINMSVLYRVVHFFGMLKNKSIYTKYLFTLTKKIFPGWPNLDGQIKCPQNQYAAV